MVDRFVLDSGMGDCILHCDERNSELRKGK